MEKEKKHTNFEKFKKKVKVLSEYFVVDWLYGQKKKRQAVTGGKKEKKQVMVLEKK